MFGRRDFLKNAAIGATAATASLSGSAWGQDPATSKPGETESGAAGRPVCIFAKHLQLLPVDRLAAFCREIEVDGIEATIRSGGQVEPKDATQGLAKLCDALAKQDRRVVIMTTDINSVESPYALGTLRSAALLGIKHYRMAYYKYDLSQKILPQLEAFARQAKELAEVNHGLGLTGLYQNHAGANYVGAPLWDLAEMLREINTEDMAIAYDVRHATVEGYQSWGIDLVRIGDFIGALYAKDYRTVAGKIENVPLGEGDVNKKLFDTLKKSLPPGPISLHMEYTSHTDPKQTEQAVANYRKDREALRQLLGV